MEFGVTEEQVAEARLRLASVIIETENAGEILTAMNTLVTLYAKQAQHQAERKQKSKKKRAKARRKAKMLKHTADEFYTVLMCAVYNKQDQINDN